MRSASFFNFIFWIVLILFFKLIYQLALVEINEIKLMSLIVSYTTPVVRLSFQHHSIALV